MIFIFGDTDFGCLTHYLYNLKSVINLTSKIYKVSRVHELEDIFPRQKSTVPPFLLLKTPILKNRDQRACISSEEDYERRSVYWETKDSVKVQKNFLSFHFRAQESYKVQGKSKVAEFPLSGSPIWNYSHRRASVPFQKCHGTSKGVRYKERNTSRCTLSASIRLEAATEHREFKVRDRVNVTFSKTR